MSLSTPSAPINELLFIEKKIKHLAALAPTKAEKDRVFKYHHDDEENA